MIGDDVPVAVLHAVPPFVENSYRVTVAPPDGAVNATDNFVESPGTADATGEVGAGASVVADTAEAAVPDPAVLLARTRTE